MSREKCWPVLIDGTQMVVRSVHAPGEAELAVLREIAAAVRAVSADYARIAADPQHVCEYRSRHPAAQCTSCHQPRPVHE